MKRPGIRFLFLLPALFGGVLPAVVRRVGGGDRTVLETVAAMIVIGVIAYGLLVWKIAIEAHRRSGIGGLFGQED